jgi:hypothetical protein
MRTVRRAALALAALLPLALPFGPAAAEILVTSSNPFPLGDDQPGGQAGPALAPEGVNNLIGSWLNTSGVTSRATVRFYSRFGTPFPQQFALGGATGPTAGTDATSVFPVGFFDESALVFFAANPRSGAANRFRDIFVQRVANRAKVGLPIAVNQTVAGNQARILAAPLSNDNVMVAWLSHSGPASSYDIRGRVVRKAGSGVSPDRPLTLNTAGAQTPTALAALANGRSVLAYLVRSGSGASLRQDVLLQRLGASGERLGQPFLLKRTTGTATYGGATVTPLPGGGYMALWFADGPGTMASLKRRIFNSNGGAGPIATVGQSRIRPTAQLFPRAMTVPDGIVVAADGFANGVYSINAWLLGNQGLIESGPKRLASSGSPLAVNSLTYIPTLDIYYAGWTRFGSSAAGHRAFAKDFHSTPGCDVRC